MRGAQIRQRQQDEIEACFAAVFEEAIDGAAGGVFALAVLAAGVEVDAHVVLDDRRQARDLVVAEGQGTRALGGNLRAALVVSPKTDAAILVFRDGMRLGDIVIERGEKEQAAHGTVGVQLPGKMLRVLLAITSQAHHQQTCEPVACGLGVVAGGQRTENIIK